jgi:hypothetical protein
MKDRSTKKVAEEKLRKQKEEKMGAVEIRYRVSPRPFPRARTLSNSLSWFWQVEALK